MKVNLVTVSFETYPIDYSLIVIKLAMEKEWDNYVLGDIVFYLETKSIKSNVKFFKIHDDKLNVGYIRMVVCGNYAITYSNYSQWVDKGLFEEVNSFKGFSLYRWIR